MYLYIYTVYVRVEHELWLLHFIWRTFLFIFFGSLFQHRRIKCYIQRDGNVDEERERERGQHGDVLARPDTQGPLIALTVLWGHFRWREGRGGGGGVVMSNCICLFLYINISTYDFLRDQACPRDYVHLLRRHFVAIVLTPPPPPPFSLETSGPCRLVSVSLHKGTPTI